jgi:glycosyltransferase involved in cell wall biosynthesis
VELDRTRSHLRPFSSKERSAIPLLGGRDRGRSDKQQNNEITNLPINYYLIVSRIVGAKGWELLLDAAERLSDRNFLIAGGSAGLPFSERSWKQSSPANIRWLGRVSDDRLWQLYENCTALLALAQDEDFGITLVEAMAAGKPVIAYAGGGYLETVIEGKTGAFFRDYTSEALVKAVKDFNPSQYKPTACRAQARKFSRQNFEQSIGKFIETKIHNSEF